MLRASTPRTSRPRTLVQRLAVRLGAVGGLVAAVALIATNGKQIYELARSLWPSKSSPMVQVAWLTAEDPQSLHKCILEHGNVFPLDGDKKVQLALNQCLQDLRTEVTANLQPGATQTLGESYFLMIENGKQKVDQLNVVAANVPYASFLNLKPESRVAVCAGFKGRSGGKSFAPHLERLEVSADGKRAVLSVPERTSSTPIGVGNCGTKLQWNYPATDR